jgi:hypothetical protein
MHNVPASNSERLQRSSIQFGASFFPCGRYVFLPVHHVSVSGLLLDRLPSCDSGSVLIVCCACALEFALSSRYCPLVPLRLALLLLRLRNIRVCPSSCCVFPLRRRCHSVVLPLPASPCRFGLRCLRCCRFALLFSFSSSSSRSPWYWFYVGVKSVTGIPGTRYVLPLVLGRFAIDLSSTLFSLTSCVDMQA